MLQDEKEWNAINHLLRLQGLSTIEILNEINVNDYVWLTLEASKSLRQTIQTLMDDCQRKEVLIQQLMSTNVDLREQLQTQTNNLINNNYVIEEMSKLLDKYRPVHNTSKKLKNELITNLGSEKLDLIDKKINKSNVVSTSYSDSDLLVKIHSDPIYRKLENKIEKLKHELNTYKIIHEENLQKASQIASSSMHIKSDCPINIPINNQFAETKSASNLELDDEQDNEHNKLTLGFIQDICSIIKSTNQHYNLNYYNQSKSNHAITCNKNLTNIKSLITQWSQQIAALPELINQLNMLSKIFYSSKTIHPLDVNSDVWQIINYVIELEMYVNGDIMVPVKDIKIDTSSLKNIVEYVRIIFGIKSLNGIYAGVSGAYRRLSELENTMKALSYMLSLDEMSVTCSQLVSAISKLRNSNEQYSIELNQLGEAVDKYETYISVFQNLMSKLECLLHVDSPDQIYNKIKRLVDGQRHDRNLNFE